MFSALLEPFVLLSLALYIILVVLFLIVVHGKLGTLIDCTKKCVKDFVEWLKRKKP